MALCFISDILYINENCTAITFEIDVMQTWLFDFEIKKSFIERMHVADDTISRNVVEEDLNFMQRYEYYKIEPSGCLVVPLLIYRKIIPLSY